MTTHTRRAVSIGSAARSLLDQNRMGTLGTVHSVFQRVVNVQTGSGRFVSFATADVPPAPGMVVTDLPPAVGWPGFGLAPGFPVTGNRREARLSGGEATVCIALERAAVVAPMIDGPVPIVPDAVPAMVEAAARHGRRSGAGGFAESGFGPLLPFAARLVASPATPPPLADPFCAAAYAHLSDLVRAVRSGDTAAVGRAARGLIGLGPGLTPSGDDALAGFMVALALTAKTLGFLDFVLEKVNPAIVEGLPGRTTELSGDFLRHAALGHGSAPVEGVAGAILAGDEQGLAAAVDSLCGVGATSGVDQLWGVLVGILLGLALAAERAVPESGDDSGP